MGAGAVADCMGGVATHETTGEHVPVTKGPVDVRTAVLDAETAGGWMVVPRGYDNLAANPTTGAKEDAIGIPPVVGSGDVGMPVAGCTRLAQWGCNSSPGHDDVCMAQG